MKSLPAIIDDILYLFFPRLCFGCSDHLVSNEHLICTRCMLLLPSPSLYDKADNKVEEMFWGRCRIENAVSLALFTRGGSVQSLIHNLKYKGVMELGPYLGSALGNRLISKKWVGEVDYIIYVPLNKSKERKRGFNQSRLIATGLSETLSIPVLDDAMERIASKGTQTTRGRYERWENVESLFVVKRKDEVRGKHLLLVDDVITTGSTIEACVNKLTDQDGVRVSVASIAATFD